MTNILNYGALNLAMALGYRARLFDVLDEFESPQPASVIAENAKLSERYIVEWLGVMVSGGIIELSRASSGEDFFSLPKEHGDLITRRAGNSNLGVYTQEIPLLTSCAMEPVFKGFTTGEGVSYDHYPRFQDFMSQLANAKHYEVLIEKFIPSIDEGRILNQLKSGIRVCDLGCAEGIAVMLMADAFPASEFIGIDISEEVIERAKSKADVKKLQNVSFLKLDAVCLMDQPDLLESFDYVTAFDSIHDQTHPLDALVNIHGILKHDGLFSMVDIAASSHLSENIDHPMGPFLYTVSLLHCMPVGLVDGGSGLGMMWGRQKAVDMLHKAGFDKVDVLDIPDDPFNLHFQANK